VEDWELTPTGVAFDDSDAREAKLLSNLGGSRLYDKGRAHGRDTTLKALSSMNGGG
jgi:hypothetical protein